MTWASFLTKLGIISISLLAISFVFASIYKQIAIREIYVMSTVIFSVFCVGIFWFARLIASRSQNYTFFGVVSGSFIIKLVIAIGFLATYRELAQPTNGRFALHFIIVYIIYTVYEVYFLTKLAKTTEA